MTDHRFFKIAKSAAVLILLTAVVTAAFFCFGGYGFLELKDAESGEIRKIREEMDPITDLTDLLERAIHPDAPAVITVLNQSTVISRAVRLPL